MIYDDYMLCKVTLGVLKGASKLNVLLLLLLLLLTVQFELHSAGFFLVRGGMPTTVEGPEGHVPQGETQGGGRKEEWVSSRPVEDLEVLCNPVFPRPICYGACP